MFYQVILVPLYISIQLFFLIIRDSVNGQINLGSSSLSLVFVNILFIGWELYNFFDSSFSVLIIFWVTKIDSTLWYGFEYWICGVRTEYYWIYVIVWWCYEGQVEFVGYYVYTIIYYYPYENSYNAADCLFCSFGSYICMWISKRCGEYFDAVIWGRCSDIFNVNRISE